MFRDLKVEVTMAQSVRKKSSRTTVEIEIGIVVRDEAGKVGKGKNIQGF